MIEPYWERDGHTIYHGDALQVMAQMPDNSIDLIAIDPPYFRVKNEPWDRQWDSPAKFLEWMGQLCEQWQRILKPNGSLYVFASPQMAARVECKIGERFNVLNSIRWTKDAGWHNKVENEAQRMYLSPWEAVVFAEQQGTEDVAQDEDDYKPSCIGAKQSVFGKYLESERERAGISRSEIAGLFLSKAGGLTGCYRNWLYGFNQPTYEQYAAMRDLLNAKCNGSGPQYLRREYEDLRREYEDLRRPFAVTPQVPYTDVWTFPTVPPRPGKHVCEKPIAMMRHIVQASSRPGAVVLDCFMGSGSTLKAARQLGRQSIGVELSAHWCERVAHQMGQQTLFTLPSIAVTAPAPPVQLALA